MSPREVLEVWIARFNAADTDGLAAMYTETAINHQVAQEPVAGREAIRALFAREFSAAKIHCIVEHIFEDGEWAIFEWRDPLGLCGCGFVQVRDGLIVFQRGYWDKLTFLLMRKLPMPPNERACGLSSHKINIDRNRNILSVLRDSNNPTVASIPGFVSPIS